MTNAELEQLFEKPKYGESYPITVRITRLDGNRQDYSFKNWELAIEFMKRTRRMRTQYAAESFEIFFRDALRYKK